MRIHLLDLDFQHVHQSVAAFVAEGPDGLALIECGPASTLPVLEDTLRAMGVKKGDLRHLFLSHIHFDHAGAAWAFAQAGAQVYVHPKGLPHLAAPEKLYNSAKMIYGDDMDRVTREYAAAEERGEVLRKSNSHGYGPLKYALALWRDGVRKGWLTRP